MIHDGPLEFARFERGCAILAYFVGSLGGVFLVKLLNYRYCFASWLWFALLSRSTWLPSIGLHLLLSRRIAGRQRPPPPLRPPLDQLRTYAGIAVALSVVEAMNSVSMSALPGSLYMLLKGSDVGWSMRLSFLLLGKRYSFPQILSSVLIMAGIVLAFIVPDEREGRSTQEEVEQEEELRWWPSLLSSDAHKES